MENTALLTAWAIASITGGLFLLWFIWLQNYYKNLYRNEVKKYCELKKANADELSEVRKRNQTQKNSLETVSDNFSKIGTLVGVGEYAEDQAIIEAVEVKIKMLDDIKEAVAKYMVKGTRNTLGGVKGVLLKVKQQKELIDTLEIEEKALRTIKLELADTYKIEVDTSPEEIITQLNGIVSDHIREKTELEAKQRIAECDKKSYMIFVRSLRKALGTKEDEMPSEMIKAVETLKKNENKKAGEVDLYYKQEMIKQMESMVGDIFVKSYENALRAYTSKQRKKAFENFFERMQPFFTGKVNAIGINNFNIKNGKNAK